MVVLNVLDIQRVVSLRKKICLTQKGESFILKLRKGAIVFGKISKREFFIASFEEDELWKRVQLLPVME